MIFSWIRDGATWHGLLTDNVSSSCYTSQTLSDLTRRAAADGIGTARTKPLTREDMHMFALGVESSRLTDDIAFEWADESDVIQKDRDVVMREGISITVTKIVREKRAVSIR